VPASPGTIDTGVFTGVPKEVKDQFVSIIPMGRIGQPREIATVALFLAPRIPVSSPASSCLSMAGPRRYDHRRTGSPTVFLLTRLADGLAA
jgi:NAD(P)-dependent dehydrogenase (short-subunit alcohol dehydrogenase family)